MRGTCKQRLWLALSGLSILLLLAAAPAAYGQTMTTGDIVGSVTDASGAVVPNARVTAKFITTNETHAGITNAQGEYRFSLLQGGDYLVTGEAVGLKSRTEKFTLLVGQETAINLKLEVQGTQEVIEVQAQATILQTENANLASGFNTAQMTDLPAGGGDITTIAYTVPGNLVGKGGAGFITNGIPGATTLFTLNGSDDMDPFNNLNNSGASNNTLGGNEVAEASVVLNAYSADYGRMSGAQVNYVGKTGTNSFHGNLFHNYNDKIFNANDFFNNQAALQEPRSDSHNFGGNFGGPILKNKLFFFFNYQRNPSSAPTSGLYSYPTAAMEAGNFSGIRGSTGAAFSPTGTLLGTYDPVALKLQSYFPGATAPGWVSGCPTSPSCPTINNFVFNGTSPNTATWYTGKVDYNISDSQRLSFSFNYFPTVSSYVPADPLYPNDATSYSQGQTDNLTGQLTYIYTITPTVLNEFRLGANRELDKYKPPSLDKNDPTSLGLEPAYGTNSPANVFPKITIDSGAGVGCVALGSGCGENGNIDAALGQGVYNVSDVITLIRGRHTIKVGGEYDKDYQDYTSWGDISSGNFEFNGGVTGIPYADFLAGDVYGWYVYDSDATSAHMWNSAVFASDDFKVTSHLTLNLGLRWQMQSGWGVNHNLFGNYDPYLPNSADGGAYKGAILFGGQSDTQYGGSTSNMSTIQNGDYKEFAPRVGVAWAPREKWSIRASYGIFDAARDAENYTDGALGLGFNPHNNGNGGYVNGSYAWKLAVGPPAGTVVYPTLQTLSPEIDNYSSVEYYPRNIPTDYVQQFLLSVQHQFAGGILVDAGYFNTRGKNLNFATDINQAPVSKLGCTGYNCGNPNPIFNSIAAQNYTGWSNYNALQVHLEKRMSQGVTFQANYTWSKALDTGTGNGHGSGVDIYQNAYVPAANYGLADFNTTNFLTAQIVYELPFGGGRQFALHGVADQIAGGWRVSTIFQWHGGVPFTPVIQNSVAEGIDTGLDSSLSAGSTLYPELIGNPKLSNPTIKEWFNPAAYTNPAPGTFGDNGRMTLIGPGFFNADFSIGKSFSLHREGMKLEIRADMYNVFNHVNYANPDANVGYTNGVLADSTAGVITGPEGGQRIIQVGGHFTF